MDIAVDSWLTHIIGVTQLFCICKVEEDKSQLLSWLLLNAAVTRDVWLINTRSTLILLLNYTCMHPFLVFQKPIKGGADLIQVGFYTKIGSSFSDSMILI